MSKRANPARSRRLPLLRANNYEMTLRVEGPQCGLRTRLVEAAELVEMTQERWAEADVNTSSERSSCCGAAGLVGSAEPVTFVTALL